MRYSQAARRDSESNKEVSDDKKPVNIKRMSAQPGGGLMGDIHALKEAAHEDLEKPTYNVYDFYWETGIIQAIAKSGPFNNITLAVISVNAVWMGYDTDKNHSDTLSGADMQFQIGEHVFAVYFSLELLIRFLAFEKKCNTMKDGWFKFDLLLCTLMVFETWILLLLSGGDGGGGIPIDTSMLRLLRLLRLSRMMRLLRKCPELITLLKGMAAAVRSVGSTLVLLIIFMYVFAIIFRQQTAGNEALEDYFGSMGLCFWTLLLQGTLMDGIGDILNDIMAESIPMTVVFMLFVLIGNFTILNMLIGVLCEVVSAVGESEAEKMTVQYAKDSFLEVLWEMDADGSGTISEREFILFVNNPVCAQPLEELGVDKEGLLSVADVIFEGGNKKEDAGEDAPVVTFGEILENILTLRSSNTAVVKDVVDFRKFLSSGHKEMHGALVQLQDRVTNLKKMVKKSMRKRQKTRKIRNCSEEVRFHSDSTPNGVNSFSHPRSPSKERNEPCFLLEDANELASKEHNEPRLVRLSEKIELEEDSLPVEEREVKIELEEDPLPVEERQVGGERMQQDPRPRPSLTSATSESSQDNAPVLPFFLWTSVGPVLNSTIEASMPKAKPSRFVPKQALS